MARDVQGDNYTATRDLDIAEIAKLVRADIKSAQRAGALPTEATIRCRIERYSGGQSLRVEIDAMPDTWTFNEPGREPDYANNIATHGGHTPAAVAATRTVEKIIGSYNRDRSDSQADYHHVRFYSGVTIRDEASQRFWAREAARTAAAAAQRRARRQAH